MILVFISRFLCFFFEKSLNNYEKFYSLFLNPFYFMNLPFSDNIFRKSLDKKYGK